MQKHRWLIRIMIFLFIMLPAGIAFTAYHHGGDTDSGIFLDVYPDKEGTKLDHCALCHSGGEYEKKPGKWVSLGSCQWCHYVYGYDESGDINETLNGYGMDYWNAGKDANAFGAIAGLDSDGDGYSNADEIVALRYPGDADDDPSKVPAASRVYTLEELENLPQHEQFLLMNTHKSGDFYAKYAGVPVEELLQDAGIQTSATGIIVHAPDGWSQYHPLEPDPDPLFYHVYGVYPGAVYYYDEEADEDITDYGWCNYSAPSCAGREYGDAILTPGRNRMLLALKRNGDYLTPGKLNEDNKLDGEGPYRIVPPQKIPGPPDQSVKSDIQDVLWPFDDNADHNAGFASRSATSIKVEPLPEGTTDIDPMEAGWDFIDEKKIIIYGAIDPVPTIKSKMIDLTAMMKALDNGVFKRPVMKIFLVLKCYFINQLIHMERYDFALNRLQNGFMNKTDGCIDGDSPDRNDWITDCDAQRQTYWAANEVSVLLTTIE